MSEQAFFLIPGLIVPAHARAHITADALKCLSALSDNLASEALLQAIGTGVFSRSAHLSWLWSVLMKQAGPAQTAAYAWSVQQGPQLVSNQVYALHVAHLDAQSRLWPVTLTADLIEHICSVLRPELDAAGLTLQRWDATLYATAKRASAVVARPFEAMLGQVRDFSQDLQPLGQEGIHAAQALIEALEATLAAQRLSDGARAINAVWLSGAGPYRNVYPPTRIRSVLADDDAILGWALAAGILKQRMARASTASSWPEDAPRGACIAVLDALYRPWLESDWTQWCARVPAVIEQIQVLSQAARSKGCESSLVVGFGTGCSVSLARSLAPAASLWARLKPKHALRATDWLFAGEAL